MTTAHRPFRTRAVLATATALLATLSACGDGEETETEPEGEGSAAADTTTCVDDASPVSTPYAGGFPEEWPFPPEAVVFDVEDRGDSGTIVTAVVAADFPTVLDFMNEDVVDAGFERESGETEEDDAEAEWTGNGFRGRWAIRESSTCPGETVIQVLAGEAS